MTSLKLSGAGTDSIDADVFVVPLFATASGPVLWPGAWPTGSGPLDLEAVVRRDPAFDASVGQVSLVLESGRRGAVVLAVGVGPRDQVDEQSLRDAAMSAARRTAGFRRLATTLAQVGPDRASSVRAVADGLLLGWYRFPRRGARASAHRAPPETAALLLEPPAARSATAREALRLAVAAGAATSWVRELVEAPGGELTPAALADVLRARARELGVTARVWSQRTMQARGFGGTLAVGVGSTHPPTVVELLTSSPGSGAGPWLGLAGKGITFDSGGLNLKRDPDEISWMKSDMAGAAAVAGAVFAAAECGVEMRVRAVLPLAENMPGGRASRPGDIVTHPGGRTTEITDTDCEGRLVLADAVAYLAGSGASAVVDVGTLTDGGGVGNALWGCWATDHALAAELVAAGATAGDPGWELPLRPEYERFLDSRVADLANCPSDVPDSGQLAATYLRTFAGTTGWVHVDNGSSAYLELDRDPWPAGATGSPTRALFELLRRRFA